MNLNIESLCFLSFAFLSPFICVCTFVYSFKSSLEEIIDQINVNTFVCLSACLQSKEQQKSFSKRSIMFRSEEIENVLYSTLQRFAVERERDRLLTEFISDRFSSPSRRECRMNSPLARAIIVFLEEGVG